MKNETVSCRDLGSASLLMKNPIFCWSHIYHLQYIYICNIYIYTKSSSAQGCRCKTIVGWNTHSSGIQFWSILLEKSLSLWVQVPVFVPVSCLQMEFPYISWFTPHLLVRSWRTLVFNSGISFCCDFTMLLHFYVVLVHIGKDSGFNLHKPETSW